MRRFQKFFSVTPLGYLFFLMIAVAFCSNLPAYGTKNAQGKRFDIQYFQQVLKKL